MKTIGMIGGVSWESTVLYYKQINEKVRAQLGGLHSAKLLIQSLNYQEIVAEEERNNWSLVADLLSDVAMNLEKSGADCIILCCNTLHKIAPFITNSIAIPFIHIADAAGVFLKEKNITKIGLLGTRFTMEDGFYSDYLASTHDIVSITPESNMRFQIDEIIYKELCVGIISKHAKEKLLEAIDLLVQQGAEAILLACTELGLLVQQNDSQIPLFDTTVMHTNHVVSLALAK